MAHQEAAAQQPFIVDGGLSVSGSTVDKASITLKTDGGAPKAVKFNSSNGSFSIKLLFQHQYIFSFSCDGYISKQISLNTICPKDVEKRGLEEPFFFKVELSKQTNNVLVDTAFYNRPVGRIFYSNEFDKFDFDRDYSLKVQKKIESYTADKSTESADKPAWMAGLVAEVKKEPEIQTPVEEKSVEEVVIVAAEPVVEVAPEIVATAEIIETPVAETVVPVEEVISEVVPEEVESTPEIVATPEVIETPVAEVVASVEEVIVPEVVESAPEIVAIPEIIETPVTEVVALVEEVIVPEVEEATPEKIATSEIVENQPEAIADVVKEEVLAMADTKVVESPKVSIESERNETIIPVEKAAEVKQTTVTTKKINSEPAVASVAAVTKPTVVKPVVKAPVKSVTPKAKVTPLPTVKEKQRNDGREEERVKFPNRNEYRVYITTDGLTTVYSIVRYNIGQIYYFMKRPFGATVAITREDFEQATK